MSIQSEVERISTNVQNTLEAIRQTGVSVPENATSDALPAAAAALANEKQDKLTGTQGQVVGFDSSGNAIAQSDPFIPMTQKGQAGGVASLDSSGKVPAGQLPEMDFIPDTEKGEANGVATLGADGKLTDGQVPAASKVGYTDNGQTSVSGALDALFQGLADGTITSQVITATSSGWSGDIPTQTLNVTGITADTMCWVGLDDSATAQQRDAARKAVMSPTALGTNSITLTCDGVQPTVDLPILIYISGGAS